MLYGVSIKLKTLKIYSVSSRMMRMRHIAPFAIALVILCNTPTITNAEGLLVITSEGKIRMNVLGAQTDRSVTVTGVVNTAVGTDALVALNLIDGKVTVDVSSSSGKKQIDASKYEGELVEVEERPQSKRLVVVKGEGGFILRQEGVSVTTSYPVRIDAARGELSVVTPNGTQHILRMPADVVGNLVNLKVVDPNSPVLTLEVGGRGELIYQINAEKTIHILNLFPVHAAVTSQVSASTGEVISIDRPIWLKLLGLLFE